MRMAQILDEVQLYFHGKRSNHLNLVSVEEIDELLSVQRRIVADIDFLLQSLEERIDLLILISHYVLNSQSSTALAAPQHLLEHSGVDLHVVKRRPALHDRERIVGARDALDIMAFKSDIGETTVLG